MEISTWMKNVIEERLGEILDISRELSEPNTTEVLIGKLEVSMSQDEFKEFIKISGQCSKNGCGDDFTSKCDNCKIHYFTSKFSKFIE